MVKMEDIWNGVTETKRRDLIVSIYNSDIFFSMYGGRAWADLPDGIKRSLNRLMDVYENRKQQKGRLEK